MRLQCVTQSCLKVCSSVFVSGALVGFVLYLGCPCVEVLFVPCEPLFDSSTADFLQPSSLANIQPIRRKSTVSLYGDTLVSFNNLLQPILKEAFRLLTESHHALWLMQIYSWCPSLLTVVLTWFVGLPLSRYTSSGCVLPYTMLMGKQIGFH